MNLPPGSLYSWEELCHQFTTNFESAYSWPHNEVDLHAVQQRPRESLRSFIHRFSWAWNTIPRISNASVVVAFQQGMKDKKMLEKLATHDVQDISELFILADKCARAVEGRVWHSHPTPEAGKAGKLVADAAAEGSGKKKKKADDKDKPLTSAPIATATSTGGGHGCQPSTSDEGGQWCPVHNSKCHNNEECREIKKLVEQFHEQQKLQPRRDGTTPWQWEGKQKVVPKDDKDEEMEFQDTKSSLKAVYVHYDSDSSTDEHNKTLHVMYGGSWDITSRRVVKTVCRAVATAAPARKEAPHHMWMETSIGFDASDCPKNMVGAGQLPLLISPTIANVRLYHILVNGGAALNLISLVAFQKL
jgi:hypothetical protein